MNAIQSRHYELSELPPTPIVGSPVWQHNFQKGELLYG